MNPHYAVTMATYNRWMNERLYQVCSELTDEQRKQDRGAFFKSIHGTLNHLLLADQIWMGRFEDRPFPVKSLDQELCSDFSTLRTERQTLDSRIEQWSQSLTDDALTGELHYTSMVNPGARKCELWFAVVHFFNHQTHHRGQLTTLISQLGMDYGVTDLLWLPR